MLNTKFCPDKADMELIATNFQGNIAKIADHYKVSRETIYQYLNRNPDGKELIKRIRLLNTESDLDLAEMVIRLNMLKHETNPAISQRAAEKVIDKKGHLRGWITPTTAEPIPTEAALQQMDTMTALFDQVSSAQSSKTATTSDIQE